MVFNNVCASKKERLSGFARVGMSVAGVVSFYLGLRGIFFLVPHSTFARWLVPPPQTLPPLSRIPFVLSVLVAVVGPSFSPAVPPAATAACTRFAVVVPNVSSSLVKMRMA